VVRDALGADEIDQVIASGGSVDELTFEMVNFGLKRGNAHVQRGDRVVGLHCRSLVQSEALLSAGLFGMRLDGYDGVDG
jgi:hypothetical protein